MSLIGIFAVLAFILSTVGVYGVISYSLSQRTREVGIRIALGAQPRHVLKLAMGQSMTYVILGTVLGFVLFQKIEGFHPPFASILSGGHWLPAINLRFDSFSSRFNASKLHGITASLEGSTEFSSQEGTRFGCPNSP